MPLTGENSSSLGGRRVAFVSHHDRNLYRFRLPIMQRLVADGTAVFAICPTGDVADRFEEHDVEHIELPIDRLTFNPVRARASIRRLRRVLERIEPDVVHSFTLRPNLYVDLAARGMRGAVVNSVTGLGSLYAGEGGIRRALLRGLVNMATGFATQCRADAVVFQNPDDRDYFVGHWLCRAGRARLIVGSGVDTVEFSKGRFDREGRARLRGQWGIEPDATVVTMIARLISSKGVREFIEAAAALRHAATFVLIGEPDSGNPDRLSKDEISRFASEAGVIRTGRQDNIPEWLHATDLYVLPSYREGLPRTVLEAMAMGLPIVTTRAPGCREAVSHGENGLLVPVRNGHALAGAIEELVADKARRARMGRRSRELAESRFRVETVVEQHLSLYCDLIRKKGGGHGRA